MVKYIPLLLIALTTVLPAQDRGLPPWIWRPPVTENKVIDLVQENASSDPYVVIDHSTVIETDSSTWITTALLPPVHAQMSWTSQPDTTQYMRQFGYKEYFAVWFQEQTEHNFLLVADSTQNVVIAYVEIDWTVRAAGMNWEWSFAGNSASGNLVVGHEFKHIDDGFKHRIVARDVNGFDGTGFYFDDATGTQLTIGRHPAGKGNGSPSPHRYPLQLLKGGGGHYCFARFRIYFATTEGKTSEWWVKPVEF